MKPLRLVSDGIWISLGLFMVAISCCPYVEESEDVAHKQCEQGKSSKVAVFGARAEQTNKAERGKVAPKVRGKRKEEEEEDDGEEEEDDGETFPPHEEGTEDELEPLPYRENTGPNCYDVRAFLNRSSPETCTQVCLALWKAFFDKYEKCRDVSFCFQKDVSSTTSLKQIFHSKSLTHVKSVLRNCKYGTRKSTDPIKQFEHQVVLTEAEVEPPEGWNHTCPLSSAFTLAQASLEDVVTEEEERLSRGNTCGPLDATKIINTECSALRECRITSTTWHQLLTRFPCKVYGTLKLTLSYSCLTETLNSVDACHLRPSDRQKDGSCECPEGQRPCALEEGLANVNWISEQTSATEIVVLAYYMGYSERRVWVWKAPKCSRRVLCRNESARPLPGLSLHTSWENRGPDCFRPNEAEIAELCTFACKLLWESGRWIAEQQSDPFEWWKTIWTRPFFANTNELHTSVHDLLMKCTFVKRNALAPIAQYMFEKWETNGEFMNECPKGSRLEFVQVLVGCHEALVQRVMSESCNYLNETKAASEACTAVTTVVYGTCKLEGTAVLEGKEACPSCPTETGVLWRWNCIRVDSRVPQEDFTCNLRLPAAATKLPETADLCECQNRAKRCSVEEAEADTAWMTQIEKGTFQLIGDFFAYVTDETGPHYKALLPDSTLCRNSSTRVLCKVPVCSDAVSTKEKAKAFDHVVCSVSCTRLLAEACTGVLSSWMCVLRNMPKECFVPNEGNKVCRISPNIDPYNTEHRTCMCPGDELPCTFEEVRATEWYWSSRQKTTERRKLLLMGNEMAMWPNRNVLPEYGLDTSNSCQDSGRYAGIFCYVTGQSIVVSEEAKTSNCEASEPMEGTTTTAEQCKYACGVLTKTCEAALSRKPPVYRSLTDCITSERPSTLWMRDCTLSWKIPDPKPKEGVVQVGLVVVSENWTSIKFQPSMDEPVVILSVTPSASQLGMAQIRNVNNDGFELRYATGACGEDYVLPYGTTGWMASAKDRYATDPYVAVRFGQVTAQGNQPVTVDFVITVKSAEPVLIPQIQDTAYEINGMGTFPIAVVESISQTRATIRVASLRPLPPGTVTTIGYVLIDHDVICKSAMGCSLSRFKLQTAVLPFSEALGRIYIQESLMLDHPMIFASFRQSGSYPIVYLEERGEAPERTAVPDEGYGSTGHSRARAALDELKRDKEKEEPILLQKREQFLSDKARVAQPFAVASEGERQPAGEQPLGADDVSMGPIAPYAGRLYRPLPGLFEDARNREALNRFARANTTARTAKRAAGTAQTPASYARRTLTERTSRQSRTDEIKKDYSFWRPEAHIVTDGPCTSVSISEIHRFPVLERSVLSVLYITAGHPKTPLDMADAYYPDCENAIAKPGVVSSHEQVAADQYCISKCREIHQLCVDTDLDMWGCALTFFTEETKKNCHIEYRTAKGQTEPPAVDPPSNPFVTCRIVDMAEAKNQVARGWDMSTHSCNCPKGMHACSATQVMADWGVLIHSLAEGGTLCKTSSTRLRPVASRFRLPQNSLCSHSGKDIVWEQLPLPPYTADDITFGEEVIRSGVYQCKHQIRYMFCYESTAGATTTTTAPPWTRAENQDCIAGRWGPWEACSAICVVNGASAQPLRRRRRTLLLPETGTGEPCSLDDSQRCSVPLEVPYCQALCWKGEWSSWSDCVKTRRAVGRKPELARVRIRHVFYAGNTDCAEEGTTELDVAACEAEKQVTSKEQAWSKGSALEVTANRGLHPRVTQKASFVDQQSKLDCSVSSEYSGCTTPCKPKGGLQPMRFRLWLSRDQHARSDYCDLTSEPCDKDRQPCPEETVDCSKVTAAYAEPGEIVACQSACQSASARCMEEASLKKFSQLQCVLDTLQLEMVQNGRRCVYAPEATGEVLVNPPACFLSETQMADPNNVHAYVKRGYAENTGSCVCAMENSVPCSAFEVFQTLQTQSQILTNTTCPAKGLSAFFNATQGGSADSTVYFATSGMQRVHCPVLTKTTVGIALPTYSSFSTEEELNTYCEKGLPFFEKAHKLKETFLLASCDRRITSKQGGKLTSGECTELCRSLVEPCKMNRRSIFECAREALQADAFASNCEIPQSGKGLIFCKHVPQNCKFSPWSEWGPCGATCKDEEYTDVYRYRRRTVLSPSAYSGVCWDVDGSSTIEMEFCSWLPLCRIASVVPPPTPPPKGPPPHVEESVPSETFMCVLTRMNEQTPKKRGYSTEFNSCICPDGSRPCSMKDVDKLLPGWDVQHDICDGDYHRDVYLGDGMKFQCATTSFIPFHFSADPGADCADYVDFLFCRAESIVERSIWLSLCVLAAGVVTGVLLALFFVQFSRDVQVALGFAGKYVQLTEQYEALNAPQETDAASTATAAADFESGWGEAPNIAAGSAHGLNDDEEVEREHAEPGQAEPGQAEPEHAEADEAALEDTALPEAELHGVESDEAELHEPGATENSMVSDTSTADKAGGDSEPPFIT